MKKVAVVILNYRVKDDTLECIKSVKKSSYKSFKIIVVDNDSQDGLEVEVKKDESLEFIQSGANLGYTGGNNLGIKRALEDSLVDYVLVLNPDTIIDTEALGNLVKAAEGKPGIYGGKIYFEDGKTLWYAGGIMDLANVLGRHRGVDEKDEGKYDKAEETDFITGAVLLADREVFEKVGVFDDKYFLYLEDADFCMRAKKMGYKCMYIPQAEIVHKNAKSTGLGSPLQDYYITRNRYLFASKFLSFRTQFALVREGIRNWGSPVRRKALMDFMLGNLGKGEF